MKKLCSIFAIACLTLLVGCNGHSDNGNPTTPITPVEVASISIALTDSEGNPQQSYDKSASITISAVVLDTSNKAANGIRVNFSADLGTLAANSTLTNSDGIATVSLSNADLAIGAGTISATVDEVSSTADYEFVDNDPMIASPQLSTSMTLDGTPTNQFRANQQVQIISTLLDENDTPIAGQIVSYTADVGVLNANSALTNAQGIANVTLSSADNGIGAGRVTATYTQNGNAINNQFNYQIVSSDTIIDSQVRLGYFDDANTFVEGKIELSVADNTISAGGTLGLSVTLLDENDELVLTPTPVTFTSNCVANGNASVDESVLSINGMATSTFADVDCAGINGTEDVIVASVAVNGITNTADENILITGESLGSIEFISAEPTSIVLKGTGGQDKQENSTLTFRVKSDLGNVLAQQEVNFSLDTTVGGITLSRVSGFTNSQGLITTQVSAGTVPTPVRVTAIAQMTIDGDVVEIKTQSDVLSINTGLPEQRSMTVSASVINPEADRFNGETSTITVWLADNFNNPVPDGTTVNFTTEGGTIQPSCVTLNGTCNVTWTSAEPRVDDHRITILATAVGHESFFDTNGNNIFDEADGDAITDRALSSGLTNHGPETSGFLDMTDAWRDDNENGDYDAGEIFLDFSNTGDFTIENGLFNGPQCEGSKCAPEGNRAIHVRKATVLIMSGSEADYVLTNNDGSVEFERPSGTVNAIPDIADGGAQGFVFNFSDLANQPMPVGTTVTVEASSGSLEGTTSFEMLNTNRAGYRGMNFFILNPVGGDPDTSVITITVSTPKNIKTVLTTTVNLL